MPEEGDGAACPAALPGEEWWVPRLVALVRQQFAYLFMLFRVLGHVMGHFNYLCFGFGPVLAQQFSGHLYKEASSLGFRGVQLFSLKLSCAPPCIIPRGKWRCCVIK
jgi:hypothetical protein